jgi:hypothetical protein
MDIDLINEMSMTVTLIVLSMPLVAIAQSNGWLWTQLTTAGVPTKYHP